MGTSFPGAIDSYVNPNSTDELDDPPHASQHTDINDAMVAVQTEVLTRGEIGYAEKIINQTNISAEADLGISATVSVGANRRIKITGVAQFLEPVGTAGRIVLRIKEDTTQLAVGQAGIGTAADSNRHSLSVMRVLTPSEGSHTYKLTGQKANAGGTVMTMEGAATDPCFILVEDIGPA